MRSGILMMAMGAMALACGVAAQPTDAKQWVGVWRGDLEGQPGVIVTLGSDAGDIEGTIVFNVVARDGGEAHVIGHDAHVMTHIQANDGAIQFQVIRHSDGRDMHLTLRLKEDGAAQLECGDCGGPALTELQHIH